MMDRMTLKESKTVHTNRVSPAWTVNATHMDLSTVTYLGSKSRGETDDL